MTRLVPTLLLAAILLTAPTHADRIPLEPGPDTSVYEGPLRDDGTVDYIAAINAAQSEGVTAENNAFVELWLARPVSEYKETDEQFAAKLGVPGPVDGPAYVGFYEFMEQPGRGGTEAEIDTAYFDALDGPFVGDDQPDIQAWLEHNAAAMDRLVAAVDRPRFYSPWLPSEDDEAGTIVGVLLPHLGMYRRYARGLGIRINYALGEGRLDDAIADLLALRRLSAHLRTEPTMISNLVGQSIDPIAWVRLVVLLDREGLDAEQIGRIEAGWLPQLGQLSMAQTIDRGERVFMLDLFQQGWADRLGMEDRGMADALFGEGSAQRLRGVFELAMDDRFDINAALRATNEAYDELIKAIDAETYNQFQQQTEAFESALSGVRSEADQKLLAAAAEGDPLEGVSGETITRVVTEGMHATMMPAIGAARRTEYHAEMRDELALVGLALSRFKLDDGTYPDTLDELVPGYVDALPEDVFINQPLRYVPDNDRLGYLLYSVGRDQEDDGGEDGRGGDIMIRVGTE